MSAQPVIGSIVLAETLTDTAQRVAIEVTAVDGFADGRWIVWGYRQYRARTRRTSYPRQYAVYVAPPAPAPAANG